MEYEVAYEISKYPFPYAVVIPGAMALISLLLCLSYISECRARKDYDILDIVKIAGTLGLCILTVKLCILGFSTGGSDEAGYAKKYYAGEYSVIECVVEEYGFSNTGIACFDVEDKSFYMNYLFRNPIPLDKEIKVSYVPDGDGEYYIVKVEVKKE